MYFIVPEPNVSGANEFGRDSVTEHNTGGQHRAIVGEGMRAVGPHSLQNAPNIPKYYVSGVDGGVNYAAPRKSTSIARFFRFNRWEENESEHGTPFQQERRLQQQQQGTVYRTPIGSAPIPYYGSVANPYARITMNSDGFNELTPEQRVAQNIATLNIPLSPRRDVRDR